MVDVSVVLWTGLLGNVLAALIALGGVYLGSLRAARIEAEKRIEDRSVRRETQQLHAFQAALTDLSHLNVAVIDLASWRQARPSHSDPSPKASQLTRDAVRAAYQAASMLALVGDKDIADSYKSALRPLLDGQILAEGDQWDLDEYRRLQKLARNREEDFVQVARMRLSHLAAGDH